MGLSAATSAVPAIGSPVLKQVSPLAHRQPESCKTSIMYNNSTMSDFGRSPDLVPAGHSSHPGRAFRL